MTTSIDQTLHLFANLLPNSTLIPILTLLPNFGGFHRTLQRVRLANRGRLHLVLSHLGLAFVLMLRPFFPELVMSTDLLSFEHPSVLLFCLTASWLCYEERNYYAEYSYGLHYIDTRLINEAYMKFENICVHSIKKLEKNL